MVAQVALVFLLGAALFFGLFVLSTAFLGVAFIWFLVGRVSEQFRRVESIQQFRELQRAEPDWRGNGYSK